MPEPVRSGQRYLPGLDGLRALAVLAVIAYHEQLGWAPGGLLGVGVFFTLSGYLITDLLLGQWATERRLGLGGFWLRRARRLLPALFVMLATVSAWITVFDRSQLAGLRGAVSASAGYVSNWYLIAAHASYFARFAPPGPFDHLWSLAVEEQFYLAWPWLLVLGLACLPRRCRGGPRWLAVPTLLLAAGSAVIMLSLYHPGFDPTRVYEGTDTRASGLLAGAALAMVWPSRRYERLPRGTGKAAPGSSPGRISGPQTARPPVGPAGRPGPSRATRLLLDAAGAAGLAAIAFMIWRVGQYSPFAYRGGMGVLSAATAAVVAAAACPGSVVGLVLGWWPLRWLGVRSYGIYLWHYPVIVLTSPANGGEDLPRAALQVIVSVALAALSWRFVEEPVRHGALGRLWGQARAYRRRPRPAGLAGWARGVLGWAVLAGASGVLVVACAGLAGAFPAHSPGATAALTQAAGPPQPGPGAVSGSGGAGTGAPPEGGAAGSSLGAAAAPGATSPDAGTTTGGTAAGGAGAGGRAAGGAQPGEATPGGAPAAGAPSGQAPLRTSCRTVLHIGDSTSEGLTSPEYLPNPARRIPARYASVGVRRTYTFIEGATSVVETLPGTINAYDAARRQVRRGFDGCWVIALGTNDTADVVVGSAVGRMARIERMMSVARGEPVMWVDVKSLRAGGPYAETYMRQWNAALRAACARYPNMRVFDWASVVRDRWFISDGIHYTSAGYAARARQIADALARAFPATGQPPGCVVR